METIKRDNLYSPFEEWKTGLFLNINIFKIYQQILSEVREAIKKSKVPTEGGGSDQKGRRSQPVYLVGGLSVSQPAYLVLVRNKMPQGWWGTLSQLWYLSF
jgi:hypothetical protein